LHYSSVIYSFRVSLWSLYKYLPFSCASSYTHLFCERNTYSSSMFFLSIHVYDTSSRTLWRIHMCAHVIVAGCARTRKRRRNVSALARWGKGFRFAPAGRGGVERSWGVKKEEKQEEERSPGVDRCSKRIEREAIRECLMPRTKLCNYLYVRLRPSWLARARVPACICGAMSCPCGGASRTSTRIIPPVHPRMLANVRICMREHRRVRVDDTP